MTGRVTDLGGDGELQRRGERWTLAATGRAADFVGDGELRRWGGRRTLVAMGSGGDGKGRGGGRVAKSLQSKQYMVSSLARVRVRTQHMERGVSDA